MTLWQLDYRPREIAAAVFTAEQAVRVLGTTRRTIATFRGSRPMKFGKGNLRIHGRNYHADEIDAAYQSVATAVWSVR